MLWYTDNMASQSTWISCGFGVLKNLYLEENKSWTWWSASRSDFPGLRDVDSRDKVCFREVTHQTSQAGFSRACGLLIISVWAGSIAGKEHLSLKAQRDRLKLADRSDWLWTPRTLRPEADLLRAKPEACTSERSFLCSPTQQTPGCCSRENAHSWNGTREHEAFRGTADSPRGPSSPVCYQGWGRAC